MSVMWKELTAEDLRAKAAENAIVIGLTFIQFRYIERKVKY